MDPITTAIVAAAAGGVVEGVIKLGEKGAARAYQRLKELLARKYGPKSDVVKSVDALEAKPASAARQGVVQEEIAAAGADKDAELLLAAQQLLDALKALPGGTHITQTAQGSQNTQVAGDRNTITVSAAEAPARAAKPRKK